MYWKLLSSWQAKSEIAVRSYEEIKINFIYLLVKIGSYVIQAGLEIQGSSDPPASVSHKVGV